MTAEIAILNRSGIALAADSAVTVGRERVWKSTNKLFSVSDSTDIGVMIYGSGEFSGIPWETVIKQFRSYIGQRKFNKVSECVDEFISFLNRFEPSTGEEDINAIFLIDDAIKGIFPDVSRKRKRDFRKLVSKICEIRTDNLIKNSSIVIKDIEYSDFYLEFKGIIEFCLKQSCTIYIPKYLFKNICYLCFEAFRRSVRSGVDTGVVFAGFGQEEILPSLHHFAVDGQTRFGLRAWRVQLVDLSEKDAGRAYVVPFAQSDIATLFMEGIQSDYLEYLREVISGIIENKSERLIEEYVDASDRSKEMALQKADNDVILCKFFDEFAEFRQKDSVAPMAKVIGSLPKEEMASMAEGLVEVTSLRRKIDSRLESVGGPVDVAIISKGDGFVWIKRKHYFDIDLNQNFMSRRDHRFSGGEDGYGAHQSEKHSGQG